MNEIPAMARQIEAYGFDELHVADDLVYRPAWPMLALAARATTRIKLGPFIVTPQIAHPVYHAANLAALDELSKGRAICGVGRGGFNPLIGIERPGRAIAMLKEAYLLMRNVMSGDRSGFNGEFFRALPECYLQYEILRADVPIYIGTWGPKMSRMAGAVASGVKADCVASPGYLRQLKNEMISGAEEAGRDPTELEMIVGPLCCIASDRERAIRPIKEMLALLQPFLGPMTQSHEIKDDAISAAANAFNQGDVSRAVDLVSQQSVDAFSLTGTPAEIVPKVRALIDAGATNIAFGPPLGIDFYEALKLLAENVVPEFR
jgi:5,10-methylenetetrahydromethanopterin reductase